MEDWFLQMKRALRLEEVIQNNIAVMDKYDPEKKVGLLVDEWGTWHKTEPGTHPRFLYMQSTLHDAIVAGLSLNIFNNYCDRVKMGNIAQTVNVLQAMVLTEGEKMLLTPTYHVFKMYTVHHDATLLPTELNCSDYTFGDAKIPSVNVSASKDSRGKIHITLCNLDPENPAMLNCELKGCNATKVTGQILTHEDINAHNTFEKTEVIKAQSYKNASIKGKILKVALPAKSVVALEIE
jgi:alpha-N-arabinofuranosidase